jgi:cell division protein FtsL
MDTVLFTDHGIVVFAIITSAMALLLSVFGLATTHHTRSEIEHHFREPHNNNNEWSSLREQFQSLVREHSDNYEDIVDAQFQTRFSQLIERIRIRQLAATKA